MRALSFVLLVSLAACDSQAPDPTSSTALDGPPVMASVVAASAPYHVTEAASVGTEGEVVVLHLGGEAFALGAGEAYLLGLALSRAGFETLDPELAAGIRPPGGDKCEEPSPGGAVALIDGRAYGGERCPPPPPPGFMEVSFLSSLLDGNVEVITAPEGLEWLRVPGGFVAEL